jgi:hypothetical protein
MIMSRSDPATLPDSRDPGRVQRARWVRAVSTVVLALYVLAGAVGVFGVREAVVTDERDGVTLEVRHASVTRAGLATPYEVVVTDPAGFTDRVEVAVEVKLLDRFDFQNFYPQPAGSRNDGTWVVHEFDPPDGDTFRWTFDVRTSPAQLGSWDTYRVRLLGPGGSTEAEVSHRMVVVP